MVLGKMHGEVYSLSLCHMEFMNEAFLLRACSAVIVPKLILLRKIM